MSGVYLYDDARARRFEPFSLTRPIGELRAGALLVRERWTRACFDTSHRNTPRPRSSP